MFGSPFVLGLSSFGKNKHATSSKRIDEKVFYSEKDQLIGKVEKIKELQYGYKFYCGQVGCENFQVEGLPATSIHWDDTKSCCALCKEECFLKCNFCKDNWVPVSSYNAHADRCVNFSGSDTYKKYQDVPNQKSTFLSGYKFYCRNVKCKSFDDEYLHYSDTLHDKEGKKCASCKSDCYLRCKFCTNEWVPYKDLTAHAKECKHFCGSQTYEKHVK